MLFNGIFKKKISIKQGEKLLTEYCKVNGFDDKSEWKKTSHAKNFFAYHKLSNKRVSNNWVSYHPSRGNNKYSVWIDLVSKEIREVLR
ncbi:MAG TPA: hypothetical protein VIM70_09480 [Clostridium sp.]|uniref:hypothetical protein n=1 Tax=Clostridium sp. TaxID=1506 RepID=UPI002F957DC7